MSLFRSAIETIATKIAATVIGIVMTVFVARTLGVEGRGEFSIAMTVALTGVSFGNLGLAASNTYFASSKHEVTNVLIGNSLITTAVAIPVCFLIWLLFSNQPQLAPLSGWMLALALIWVPIGIGMLLMQNLLLGMQQVHMFNVIELIKQGGTLLAIFLAWAIHLNSPEGYFSASLLVLGAMFVFNAIYVISKERKWPSVSISLLQQQVGYATKAYLAALFMFLVLKTDLLMIKYFKDDVQAGQYSVAMSIADVLYMAPVAIGTVLFPRLSSLKDEGARWVLTAKVIKWTVLITGLSVLILMFSTEIVIDILFGKAYHPAAPAAMILLPAVAMLSVNTVLMNYFASMGMPLFTVVSPGIATGINILANYFLISSLGIVGAAWASFASYGFMLLMSLGYVWVLRNGYGKE